MGVIGLAGDGKPPPRGASAKDKQDDMIMNTNNSCIVSKRSVEKIYHKEDAGLLRHFVKKFQRRSPLINRGYWLRMRAIEHAIRAFLASEGGRPKAIVNLGCGYDIVPFNFIKNEAELCNDTTFIDVDYQQLIRRKVEVIQETEALNERIAPAQYNTATNKCIHLRSRRYVAASCDLQSTKDLAQLREEAALDDFDVLLVAEVSMTYMDQQAADGMIEWASSLPKAKFCLLEQFLPDGKDSAFGRTMLKHFVKLQSPLKSAMRYPSLADQRKRFTAHGWKDAKASSLWQLWCEDSFLAAEDRRQVDLIEPFDEWEEFILFASHYCVLVASQSSSATLLLPGMTGCEDFSSPNAQLMAEFHAAARNLGERRYGASFTVGDSTIFHHGGHGVKGRLADADAFRSMEEPQDLPHHSIVGTGIMCHTITPLRSGARIMVGGRTSPDHAERTCRLWEHGNDWQRVDDLPIGRYRHCAVASGSGILLMTGKHTSTDLASEWLYWDREGAWRNVDQRGQDIPCARFGACATALLEPIRLSDGWLIETILSGGIDSSGKILSDVWGLSAVDESKDGTLHINCVRLGALGQDQGRFGSRLVDTRSGLVFVGGCPVRGVERGAELMHINREFHAKTISLSVRPENESARPLLAGHAVETVDEGRTLVVIGGGAVCFSFGTVWNPGIYQMELDEAPISSKRTWRLDRAAISTSIANQGSAHYARVDAALRSQHSALPTPRIVRKVGRLTTAAGFRSILEGKHPVILRDLDIGPCQAKWSLDYLKQAVGCERTVTVHECQTGAMSFLDKNFAYARKTFDELITGVANGSFEYMRAVSSKQPTSQATSLQDDFPELAGDFKLPSSLKFVEENSHSSVLRVSGPVKMWLHYDVMSNVLFQVRGNKRLILYAPKDVDKLGFLAGASSSRLDALEEEARKQWPLCEAQAYEADLDEGEALFIPALWAHAAAPTHGTPSVAVNVFFRDLESGYAAGKDVYGNRDLAAYENGRKEVERIVRAFRGLPREAGGFYLRRLASELRDCAGSAE